MSTKTTTSQTGTSNLQYDPGSMGQYKQNIGSFEPMLRQMASNPFGNPFTQMLLQQGTRSAIQQGGNSQKALQSMMKTQGMPGGAAQGFGTAMQGLLGRQTAAGVSQAQQNAYMQGLQRQMQAIGMGSMFQPLMTGEANQSQSSQTTGGLGTWLPQLAGSLLSGAMAAGTGGMSSLAGMGGSMPFSAGGAPTAVPGMVGMTGLGPGSSWMPMQSGVMSNFTPAMPTAPNPYLYGSNSQNSGSF